MVTTEHIKLIYQLSRVYQSGRSKNSLGTIYPKSPMMECSQSYNIWAKRAYKKGYLNLVEESADHWLFSITDKGLALLKNYPDYYLQKPNTYDMFKQTKKSEKIKSDDELKRQRRRERRRLRKLRQGR